MKIISYFSLLYFFSILSVSAGSPPTLQYNPKYNFSLSIPSFIHPNPAYQQLPDKYPLHLQNSIDINRLYITGGVSAAAGIGIHIGMQNAWWSGTRGPFHFAEDHSYARDLDKIGHVYAGYAASTIFYRMVNWTGMGERRSAWYGASLGLLFELYIEVQDGFATFWGFERWDAIADLAGAVFFLARFHYEPLQYFQMKFSYYPSSNLGKPKYGGNGMWDNVAQSWADDYEGHAYWLSFRAGEFAHDLWEAPSWMRIFNIAAGWSLAPHRERTEVYIGLDWNLEALPGSNWYWRRFLEWLDLIKFPAPAVRILPDGVLWYGLYL